MKKILLAVLTIALFLSCEKGDTKNTMNLTGNIKGLKKGTLYLQHIADSVLVTIDSLPISGDGNFTFKTELESPEIFYLYLNKKDNNDVNDRITFFAEPGNISIITNWNTFDTNAKIEGSETQKKLEEYQKVMSSINLRNMALLQSAANPEKPLDSVQFDSIARVSGKNVQRGYAYALNFALNNTDSYIAPYIALYEVPDANRIYLDSINKSLSPAVAGSKYGKALKALLAQ
ncbi:MAG: DUF4369 domain-containing protein [Flavobacteriaceae bacterium]